MLLGVGDGVFEVVVWGWWWEKSKRREHFLRYRSQRFHRNLPVPKFRRLISASNDDHDDFYPIGDLGNFGNPKTCINTWSDRKLKNAIRS